MGQGGDRGHELRTLGVGHRLLVRAGGVVPGSECIRLQDCPGMAVLSSPPCSAQDGPGFLSRMDPFWGLWGALAGLEGPSCTPQMQTPPSSTCLRSMRT